MMHLIKQLASLFSKPLVIAVVLWVASSLGRLAGRPRAGAWLSVAAAMTVYLGAAGWVGDSLIGSLERQYPTLQDDSLPKVGYVVVLGSRYVPREGIAVTGALDEDGLVRIAEGVRLVRRLGAARLVVSGGASPGEVPPAFGYAEFARQFGVDDASIIVLSGSLDTYAEARSVATLLGASPFILVTSAYHMPRAMRLMERAGAHAIPAPTGQRAERSNRSWGEVLPTASGLSRTEHALHEYLGLAALTAGADR
jgi:uncharacterized SAM-binding protein YcdF (DUF218 family)